MTRDEKWVLPLSEIVSRVVFATNVDAIFGQGVYSPVFYSDLKVDRILIGSDQGGQLREEPGADRNGQGTPAASEDSFDGTER